MSTPWVSVVIPTHNRPKRLAKLLKGLRKQSIGLERFEVIVCDDCSTDPEVGRLLDSLEGDEEPLDVRVVRRQRSQGPAAARNSGWRLASALLVAFIDDDCVPTERWLEALLDAWRRGGATQIKGAPKPDQLQSRARLSEALVVGQVQPDPSEYPHEYGPFSTSLWVKEAGPRFETANIAYPRALLERLDGFDESLAMAGEDTDLAWRAIELGAQVVWASSALVYHGVINQGPWGKLKKGWRWRFVPAVYNRHPALRKHLIAGIFWGENHWWLFRALVALALPGYKGGQINRKVFAISFLRWWLAYPYIRKLTHYRTGPLLAPYRLACDVVEVVAIGKGAIEQRTWMI